MIQIIIICIFLDGFHPILFHFREFQPLFQWFIQVYGLLFNLFAKNECQEVKVLFWEKIK